MSDEIKVNSELPQKLATLGQVKDALDKRDEKIGSLKEELDQLDSRLSKSIAEISDELISKEIVVLGDCEKVDDNYWHIFNKNKPVVGNKYILCFIANTNFTCTSIQVGTANASAHMRVTLAENVVMESGKTYDYDFIPTVENEQWIRVIGNASKFSAVKICETVTTNKTLEEVKELYGKRITTLESDDEKQDSFINKNTNEKNAIFARTGDVEDYVHDSLMSLATLKLSNDETEIVKTIPVDATYGSLIVRFALHYGDDEGTIYPNEVFFGGRCKKDFSDVRFFDADGNMLDSVIETRGNYDFIKDAKLRGNNLSPTMHLADGTLVGTNSSSYPCLSSNNGNTWNVLSGATGIQATAFFVDSHDNIYASGRIKNTSAYNKVYKFYASTNYATSKVIMDWTTIPTYAYVYNLGCAEDDKGYLYFGRYQLGWKKNGYPEYWATLYRSTDGGENFSVCYEDTLRQHIHGVTVDKNTTPWTVYVGIDNSDTSDGPACVRSVDNGATWQNVPIPYKNPDYFCYHANGYHLGGGEANILGGYTVYKTTNPMDATKYKPVVNTSQGIRSIVSVGDKIIYGGCAGDTNCVDQICMSDDNGETWRTVYSEDWDSAGGSGNGVRWITEPFVPKGATEEQVIINGNGRPYGIRGYFGGDRHYAICYVNLGNVTSENKAITVKCGYAMEYPRKRYTDIYNQIDKCYPLFKLPMRDGNGDLITEELTGNKGKIVGNYEWLTCDNLSNGYIYPKHRNNGYALKLNSDAYVNLGHFSKLNKNKGITIAFKMNTESPNGLYQLDREHILLSNDAFDLAIFQNRRFGIRWKSNGQFTRSWLHLGALQTDYFNTYFVCISNDAMPKITTYVNDSANAMEEQTSTYWENSYFSLGDLYLGSKDGNSIGFAISDLVIFDKILSAKERAKINRGFQTLPR